MDLLTRLRALEPTTAAYDALTDAEHVAVLDASELLDELRPQGYALALTPDGRLRVTPPERAEPAGRARIAALADALAFVLRLEAGATPLPDACRVPGCGQPVDRFTPNGHPYCAPHYALAARRARERGGRGGPG